MVPYLDVSILLPSLTFTLILSSSLDVLEGSVLAPHPIIFFNPSPLPPVKADAPPWGNLPLKNEAPH